MTIRSDMRDRVSYLGHGTTTGQVYLTEYPLTRTFDFVRPVEANATDAITTYIIRFPVAVRLMTITLNCGVTGATPAVTASDTNYATLTLSSANGAGGGLTTVFACTTKTTGSTGTGNWTANNTLNAAGSLFSTPFVAPVNLAAGSVLRLAETKANAGVITAYSLSIVYQLNG